MTSLFAAVDLGASSGRVVAGRVGPETLELTEGHRFVNEPVRLAGTLHWNVAGLYAEILRGLRFLGRDHGVPTSIGVDSWAVDYGLLDDAGALLGPPVHYRDERTEGVAEEINRRLGPDALYQRTGLQILPFNTIYQLVAARDTAAYRAAHDLLLVPDLIGYWLTGARGAEVTNASTTQLLDVHTRTWDTALASSLGLRPELLPALRQPGESLGGLREDVATEVGFDAPVVAVASHDTASAVIGVPAVGDRFAYISCGTWGLAGLELDRPVLSSASREANFTNEAGIDGTVRYLRNVMGLWLLQESVRWWERSGLPADLPTLLADAAGVPAGRTVIDVDDARFLPPGDMPGRIAAYAAETGQPVPSAPDEIVRCILDSLALAFRRTLREAADLASHDVDVVHIVGGGARNALLCQLTADATGLPVVAGPVEATALGNVLVQARAAGLIADLSDARRLLAATQATVRYEPRPGIDWDSLAGRLASSIAKV
ncbi:rhamnulokinase [Cryptosporangium aurantiacum]|uniref:Rhamnulokinase n=1 Tax=Cryptosporangium aurantiacum TaxID=134849 RepID=A0A1M7R909_9ACTN|nr:rhamnulokinase family protein [Cryptosporangium aurantiacum]SHN42641.1 rhamnulokinase [Cryptosporangium aurantiacum]